MVKIHVNDYTLQIHQNVQAHLIHQNNGFTLQQTSIIIFFGYLSVNCRFRLSSGVALDPTCIVRGDIERTGNGSDRRQDGSLWSLASFVLEFTAPQPIVCWDRCAGAGDSLSFDASGKVEQCTTTCFVDAVNGDDANSGATPAAAKRTIQAAVDAVQPGGEVHASPGIYVEQVVIAKSLRLLGAGKATETWLQAPDDIPHAESPDSAIITISGANVKAEITGLTIAGPGPSVCGGIGAGVFVRDGAYADIHNNIVRDIRDQPMSNCHYGVAIQVGRSSLNSVGVATIRENEILGYQKNGITVSGVGSHAGPTEIIAQNGVQVSDGASAMLKGNTITGHSFSPLGDHFLRFARVECRRRYG